VNGTERLTHHFGRLVLPLVDEEFERIVDRISEVVLFGETSIDE